MTDVCMVVRNAATHDSRVQREAASLTEAGLNVVVLAATEPGLAVRESKDGYRIERLGDITAPTSESSSPSLARQVARDVVRNQPGLHALVTRMLTTPGRMRFALEAYERLRALRPGVIHSHDLDTLG